MKTKILSAVFLFVFLIASISAYTYYWGQFDGSVSYYEVVATSNPDIKEAKLIMIEDVVLGITRQPYIQEQEENNYIPACFEN